MSKEVYSKNVYASLATMYLASKSIENGLIPFPKLRH